MVDRRLKPLTVAALGATLVLALIGAAEPSPPTKVPIPAPGFAFFSVLSPTTLPATLPAPIKLKLLAEFSDPYGGSQPPAVRQLAVKVDRNLTIDTQGLPACFPSLPDEPINRETVRERCKPALVGHGSALVSLPDPDLKAFRPKLEIQIYNGGTKRGTTTLFAYAPIRVPVPDVIVAKIKIKRIREGHFGSEATVSIPKIAGGSGAIMSLHATLGREYLYKRERKAVLSARCPSGAIFIDARATFADKTVGAIEDKDNCTRR